MARNIEIKARVGDAAAAAALRQRAVALAGREPEILHQDDSFFVLNAGRGRLKLRQFADGHGELIHYHRADDTEARASDYVRVPLADATACAALREALSRGLGLLGRVQKQRQLLHVGRTRVHLDEVTGLGHFMELEVVLAAGDADAAGVAEAEGLMQALGLAEAPRLAGSYLDLLTAGC
jgi:predicted adenylyl cyclase CyaB